MSRHSEGVPQTVAEAKEFGWTWLNVRCLGCKHSTDLKFLDMITAGRRGRLGALTARLYCSKCKGRDLEFALGAYVADSGQPMHERRRIDFRNGVAVRPDRG